MTPVDAVLDLVARASRLLGDDTARRDVRGSALIVGAPNDNRGDGTAFLGSDPVPGVYAIEVVARDEEVGDVVLRLTEPVSLAFFASRFGPYEVPSVVTGHVRLPEVQFLLPGSVVTARCESLPGRPAQVVEVVLRPR